MTYAIVYDRTECNEMVMETAPSVWALATAIACDSVKVCTLDDYAAEYNEGEYRREDMRVRFIQSDLNVEALLAVKNGHEATPIVDILTEMK